MSHVHREWNEIVVGIPNRERDTHDCPDCLAREKAQEELVAEFVRQEERIERLNKDIQAALAVVTDYEGWLDDALNALAISDVFEIEKAKTRIAAREEEVKRLREALKNLAEDTPHISIHLKLSPFGEVRHWAAPWSLEFDPDCPRCVAAREALSSLDAPTA